MKRAFRQGDAPDWLLDTRHGPATVTAPTVDLFTPGNSQIGATRTLSLPSVATTLATLVAAGSSSVRVVSATGINAGDRLWLGTVGESDLEMVRVRAVTNAIVDLSRPLVRGYASGQDVRGATLTLSLATSDTATLDRNYRADWTYEVGGAAKKVTLLWDVVKRPFQLAITPEQLQHRLPSYVREALCSPFELEVAIAEAEADVKRELCKRRLDPHRVRDPDQLDQLGVLYVERLYWRGRTQSLDARESLRVVDTDIGVEWDSVMSAKLSWYDEDEDLAVDTPEFLGDFDEESQTGPNYLRIG